MAKRKKLKTPAEARHGLAASGLTIAGWAREHGLRPRHVYDVLSGRNRGAFGEAHRIAVLLGIKEGETSQEAVR